MRILFLTHRTPYPPDKGEKIRAFHELKYLAAKHEVDLFCLADSAQEIENAAYLKRVCRSVHAVAPSKPVRLCRALRSFLVGHPFSFGYFESSELRRAVRDCLKAGKYDVIFVYCSSMSQYVPQPAPVPVIVDFVDADSNKFLQYAQRSSFPLSTFYRSEAGRVASQERRIGELADLSLVTTSCDAEELGGSAWSGSEVKVLSNGIETPPTQERNTMAVQLQPFVLFLGTMSYWPNADAAAYFARNIYPRVRKLNPELKFVIAGRDPVKRVRDLGRLPGVAVVGTVPDPFEYFRAAEVSVAPFRMSQGFQNKIAESLAVGTPVVASRRAAAAIGLSEREGLFTAQSPDEFAIRVTEVVANSELRQALKEKAPIVRKQLSWESKLSILPRYLEQVDAKAVRNSEAGIVAAHGVEER